MFPSYLIRVRYKATGLLLNKKLTVIKKDNYYCHKAYNYENWKNIYIEKNRVQI